MVAALGVRKSREACCWRAACASFICIIVAGIITTIKYINICCHLTDLAVNALLTELKQRGLLDETLIIWGGEFGRTPMIQYKGGVGRDHHIKGFSMWMAGGGVESGTSYGNTDELGYHAIENPVHVPDLHATMQFSGRILPIGV